MSLNHRAIVSLALSCCLVTFVNGICTFLNGELACITNDLNNVDWNIGEQLRQSGLSVPLTDIKSVRIISNITDGAASIRPMLSLADTAFSGMSNLEQFHLLRFAFVSPNKALNGIAKTLKLLNLTRTDGQFLLPYAVTTRAFPELTEAYFDRAFATDTTIEISTWARAAPKLKKLVLRHNKICQLSGDSQEDGKMLYLEHLDLHDTRCGRGLQTNDLRMNFFAYFPRLLSLDMSATELDGPRLDEWISQAVQTSLIQTLNIAECPNIRTLSKNQFQSFTNLKHLNLSSNNGLVDVLQYAFAGLHLQTLNLSGIPNIKLGGANVFANMTVKNLDLSLMNPPSTSGSTTQLFWQQNFLAPIRSVLIVLNLSGRAIPTGTVLSLDNLPSLEVVKLSRMNLTSESLSVAPNNSVVLNNLRLVDLSENDLTAFSNETGAMFERFWKKESKLQKLLLHNNPRLQCRACGNSYLMRWIANDSDCREKAKHVLCKGVAGSAYVDCPVCVDGTLTKRIDEFSVRDFAHCGGGNCKMEKNTNGATRSLLSYVCIAYVSISALVFVR